jgi:intracellular multiplication protein IcmE
VEETYSKQIGDLFSQWAGRTPRTDVVLPPSDESGTGATDDASDRRAPASSTSRKAPLPAPAMAPATAAAEILIPAGRGVYAHPILSVNSDGASPGLLRTETASCSLPGRFTAARRANPGGHYDED